MFYPGRTGDSAGSQVTQQLMGAETSGLDIATGSSSSHVTRIPPWGHVTSRSPGGTQLTKAGGSKKILPFIFGWEYRLRRLVTKHISTMCSTSPSGCLWHVSVQTILIWKYVIYSHVMTLCCEFVTCWFMITIIFVKYMVICMIPCYKRHFPVE